MKRQKKELAANIAETIQSKLKDSVSGAEELKKAIRKTANKLAEKWIKITVKQEKEVKKANKALQPVIKTGKIKKKKTRIGLKGTPTTERQSLTIQKKPKEAR